MIVIGSKAAEYRGLVFSRQVDTNEYDIIGTKEELKSLKKRFQAFKCIESKNYLGKYNIVADQFKIEFDATGNLSNALLIPFSSLEHYTRDFFDEEVHIPTRIGLYLIKRSHANISINFEKTLADLVIMQRQWPEVKEIDLSENCFYLHRRKEAEERNVNRQSRINFNKSNEEFFMGGKELRIYEHDSLHRAIAFYDAPLFERCKKDPTSAKIDMSMFFAMSHDDQIKMAMEEAMVISLERYIIPVKRFDLTQTEKNNFYRKGLIKLAKDLCKGKFQDFIIDNILELSIPKWEFVEKFMKGVDDGTVKQIQN